MGMNDFAPYLNINGIFLVKNISQQKKTIKIFNYPILSNQTRDLLKIPGVSESDIRASLLKGELLVKILAKEIVILDSDIDLLQFNEPHKLFLQNAGVVNGLQANGSGAGVSESDHQVIRQLIHFIDDGPADGFTSGAYKVIVGQPFPSSITWYVDSTQTQKIVEKLIIRDNSTQNPIIVTWNLYNTDGTTIVHSVVDNVVYDSSFESTRTRTII